jgi:hypothetical protein
MIPAMNLLFTVLKKSLNLSYGYISITYFSVLLPYKDYNSFFQKKSLMHD